MKSEENRGFINIGYAGIEINNGFQLNGHDKDIESVGCRTVSILRSKRLWSVYRRSKIPVFV